MSKLVGDAIFRTFVAADRPCRASSEVVELRRPELVPELARTSSLTRTSSTVDFTEVDARWVETPRVGELCAATARLNWESSEDAKEQVLTLEALVSEIHSYLGGRPSQLRAPFGGKAWSVGVRRAHRDGRRLMAVCRCWRGAVASNSAFFGRLLVPVSQRLPSVARLHGHATKWLTVDGGRIETPPKSLLRVASLRSRSRSPRHRHHRSLVYFDDDDQEDERRRHDHHRRQCHDDDDDAAATEEDDDDELEESTTSSSLASFERGARFMARNFKQKTRVPTEATVALWAAVGLLPSVECLELTRCHFLPNRSASPANVLRAPHLGLRSLCLYRCAGLTADVLADLVALCPNLDTLELHHACPWHRQAETIIARSGGLDDDDSDDDDDVALSPRTMSTRTPRPSVSRSRRRPRRRNSSPADQDSDDSVAAWIAGIAMGSSRVRTLRLGDGLDDDALEWVAQLPTLCSLNVMHTYALDTMARGLRAALGAPRLLALSIHVDGEDQSCDDAARAIAESASALSLRVLALGDHVPAASQAQVPADFHDLDDSTRSRSSGTTTPRLDTLTDAGLLAVARGCRVLSRLMLDDAGAVTVAGVSGLVLQATALDQLVLRRCFDHSTFTHGLRDLARHRRLALLIEPRGDHHLKLPHAL